MKTMKVFRAIGIFASVVFGLFLFVAVFKWQLPEEEPGGKKTGTFAKSTVAPAAYFVRTVLITAPYGKDSHGEEIYEWVDVTGHKFNVGPADGERGGCIRVKVNNLKPQDICKDESLILGKNTDPAVKVGFRSKEQDRTIKLKVDLF